MTTQDFNEAAANDDVANSEIPTLVRVWLDALQFTVGDTIMIIPAGAISGQGFQGELVNVIFGDNAPQAFVIRNAAGDSNVVINWDSVTMVTKVVNAPSVEDIQAKFEADTGEALAAYAEKHGFKVGENNELFYSDGTPVTDNPLTD